MGVLTSIRRDDKSGDDNGKVHQLQDVYIVTVEDGDDQATVLNSSAVPQVGDAHPNPESDAVLKNRFVSSTMNRNIYNLAVSYDNAVINEEGVKSVTVGGWRETFIMERDHKGEFIEDTAHSKIKLEKTRPHPQLTVVKQTIGPNLQIVNLEGSVNLTPVNWLGFDFKESQLKFESYIAKTLGNNTWEETFIFRAKIVPDLTSPVVQENTHGWQDQLLDAGIWEVVDGKRRPIHSIDADGKRASRAVTTPWPLQQGEAIPLLEIELGRTFLTFDTSPTMSFDIFPFDFTPLTEASPEGSSSSGGGGFSGGFS